MNHLHWVIPDLFLPDDAQRKVAAGLQLPYLEKLLGRGERSTGGTQTLDTFLRQHYQVNALAPIRAKADGLNVESGYWLCADPVNLNMQQSQVILQPTIECSANEAAALVATLNTHFAQDGLEFFAPHPLRWYVRSEQSSEVVMTALADAAWKDVKPLLPQGADALRWQSVSNEAQMLLYGHAVNQTRGAAAINSIWLWGGGQSSTPVASFDAIGGGESLSAACAQLTKATAYDNLSDLLFSPAQQGLWVSTALQDAWRRGDLYQWREQLQNLEFHIAQPLWGALKAGKLQSCTLEILMESSSVRFELNRLGCWKVWRLAKPLASYVV